MGPERIPRRKDEPVQEIRRARLEDHEAVVRVMPEWWADSRTPEQARQLTLLLPRLFFEHFSGTSLVMDGDDGMHGFLVGFHSADHPDEAYIHFVGVDPRRRKDGVARALYERFFEEATAAGRTKVKAITSPANTGSIAFHRAMGFDVHVPEPGYDGPGQDRVRFEKTL